MQNSRARRTTDTATLPGQRIRIARKKRRLSQDQLAEKLDTIRGYVSKVERGMVNIGVDGLMELCRALEVTPQDLLIDTDMNGDADVREALRQLLRKGTEDDLKRICKLSTVIIS